MTTRWSPAGLATRALRALDPERAHDATIALMRAGLAPSYRVRGADAKRLRTQVAGIDFPNPLGLAAGFDKNARVWRQALGLGFGFVEVGAATPRPQPGNPRPRVFRLPEERAVINRYGFNNDGAALIASRLPKRTRPGVVGVNLGANKLSMDRTADYVAGVQIFEGRVDFYTVNISSPNTPGLRDLQGRGALDELLARVLAARDDLDAPAPVFLKVAPDLNDADKTDIAASARAAGVDGLIVSNTTLARPEGLRGAAAGEKGGLSGPPLLAPSTALLREFYSEIGDVLPIIGVGGVASADDAFDKLAAGASLVQLYTGLVYQGPGLVGAILRGLAKRLAAEGVADVQDVVGAGAR